MLTLIVPLILLAAIAMTPVTVTEDALARTGRHTSDLSQAASVRNSCLNPVSDSNTNDNMISNGNCGVQFHNKEVQDKIQHQQLSKMQTQQSKCKGPLQQHNHQA